MKVFPVRFTDDPAAMRRFLEALGLTTTLQSDGGGWIALEGAGGGVGLHDASATESPRSPGETSLSFESDEPLEQVQERLAAAGFPSDIIDESFGRSLRVVDPDGQAFQINEAMTDDYGYGRL
jgi:hypothetical protein